MEKKKADIGLPPKLTKDKLVYKWLEQLNQYLADVIGVLNAPFTYLTWTDAHPPAILAARVVDQPYSVDYESIEHKLKFCVSHNHTLSKLDNRRYCYLPDSYPILQAIYHQHHAFQRRSTHCFLDIARPDGALGPHLCADGHGRVGKTCRLRGLL